MAKNPIKVMSSMLTGRIYAGRVNEKTSRFVGNKEDVTDTAITAVIEHLYKNDINIAVSIKGKEYILSLDEK